MPHDFQSQSSRKNRSRYVGSWTETTCRNIPLPFTIDSVRRILDWGIQAEGSPYTHQEIARWCDRLHLQFLDTDASPELEAAIRIAADVDCQWDLFLANTFSLDQLQLLDFAAVKLPLEWFADWQQQLTEQSSGGNSAALRASP